MHIRRAVVVFPIFLTVFCPLLAAQNNPVPFVNNSLVPASAVPGGANFTLQVNGAGFVKNISTVNWNGSPRPTTVINGGQLTAAIPSTDLAMAATIPVTVSNPMPGGGVSNAVLFEVTTPTSSLSFTRTESTDGNTIFMPTGMAVGYVSPSIDPLLAVADNRCARASNCLISHATVSFFGPLSASYWYTGDSPESIALGDFNGDGNMDMVTLGNNISVSLGLLNNIITNHLDYPLPVSVDNASPPVTGDFNRDGRLDLVIAALTGFYFLPGNGDGTFGAPVFTKVDPASQGANIVAGDFNGDGNLDLAVSNLELSGGSISILLGNGDGTFQPQVDYPIGSFSNYIAAADFNGDGKLDLAVINGATPAISISIFIGNGDGTFQPRVDYPAAVSDTSMVVGDFNGDGIQDLAIADSLCTNTTCPTSGSVNVFLGNGDGTFQSPLNFATEALPGAIASGEFHSSGSPVGRMGFAVANSSANSISIFAPFQPTGTTNPLPTISNISPQYSIQGSSAFTLTITGTNFVAASPGLSGSTVSFGMQAEPTTFVSATQLTAEIPATAVTAVGSVPVTVFTPAPGGGNSTSAVFSVYYPSPTISSLSVTSVPAGSPAFSLTIDGANFVPGATLDFNGVVQPFTFISSTQVTTTVAATAVASPVTIAITIANPLLGIQYSSGGTSPAVNLTVAPANIQPTVGELIPSSAMVGQSVTVQIIGNNFGPSPVVLFGPLNGLVKVSSGYQSPTTLQASIPASATATAGIYLLSVQNPNGIQSALTSFTVNNPVPAESSVSPTSVAPGSGPLTLTVTGSNFNSSSVVQVGSVSLVPASVTATSLTAVLPAIDVAPGALLAVTVSNPPPGGGKTSSVVVAVADFVISASPAASTVPAGQPGSFPLAVAPLNGTLGNTVTFTAAGTIPIPNATISVIPSSLPPGSKSATVTLSIATTAHSAAFTQRFPRAHGPQPHFFFTVSFVFGLIWIGLWAASVPPRRFAPQFLAVFLLALASALAACGTSAYNSSPQINPATGTPAGTYPIVVTATSGNVSLKINVTLTVD